MRVAYLEGALLDYWVALAEDIDPLIDEYDGKCKAKTRSKNGGRWAYSPSTNWVQASVIITENLFHLCRVDDAIGIGWMAYIQPRHEGFGPTPLIAGMRAYVASKFGDEVEDVK